ncbi:MAG TPA: hypothetical protein VGG28_16455 [Kofleriaceae bacterium]|jgi:hypothetical protein
MQLTPETMAEISRIFDDPEPESTSETADTRFVVDDRYGRRAPQLVEVRALLTWLAYDDDVSSDDDSFEHV